MLVIGHRGAAGLAPENTLEALRAGYNAGADMLEMDVRLTKDGVLILSHDFHTLRTHKNVSVISKLTLAELRQKIKGSSIVTLDEVLDEFFGKIILNIEAKGRRSGRAIVDCVAKRIHHENDWDSVIVSSFLGPELSAARRASKQAQLALLHLDNPFLFMAYHRTLHLSAVGFHRHYADPLALQVAKKLGLFTYVYTINTPELAAHHTKNGLDGIVTDFPDRFSKR